jgi:hypothetical protein
MTRRSLASGSNVPSFAEIFSIAADGRVKPGHDE